MKLRALKNHLKSIAHRIHTLKQRRKTEPNGYVPGLKDASFNYRVNHIAYCLLRGKTLEQVESHRLVSPPNPESQEEKYLAMQVDRIVHEYREEVEHAVPV